MFSSKENHGFKILSNKSDLFEERRVDLKSRLFLYFSVFILLVSFLVILLNDIGVFYSYDDAMNSNKASYTLFLMGVFINFICVPVLYWSSFNKFKKGDGFWDSESFWILPLFFFGSFFQYIGELPYVMITLPFSLILIFSVHIWTMKLSRELISLDANFENSVDYFKSTTYLTAYYLILAVIIVFFDLFDRFYSWFGI